MLTSRTDPEALRPERPRPGQRPGATTTGPGPDRLDTAPDGTEGGSGSAVHRDGGATGRSAAGAARCDVPAARTAIVLAATALGVPLDAVLADHRCIAPVATARQVAMYLAHVELGLPQAEVARAFQRDRSTVAHACRRIEDMRDRPAFDETVARLAASARFAVRS